MLVKQFVSPRGKKISIYQAEDLRHQSLIAICPGGGFSKLAPREMAPIAEEFNHRGFNAAVIEYTVDHDNLLYSPILDYVCAIGEIRKLAPHLGSDPNKIIGCSFSAGGNVVGLAGASGFNHNLYGNKQEYEQCRLNGMILSYSVLSCEDCRHERSFLRISTDRSVWRQFSVEHNVSDECVPAFIWHTAEDQKVSVKNSMLLAEVLLEKHLPCELHIFPRGLHGMSLATPELEDPCEGIKADPHVAQWFDLCEGWLISSFEDKKAQDCA